MRGGGASLLWCRTVVYDSEGKYMFCVDHGTDVQNPCVKCMASMEYIGNLSSWDRAESWRKQKKRAKNI